MKSNEKTNEVAAFLSFAAPFANFFNLVSIRVCANLRPYLHLLASTVQYLSLFSIELYTNLSQFFRKSSKNTENAMKYECSSRFSFQLV